ncbi:MAG: nucleotidyltransferase family protein [Ruminococcus sp.]|nr:nucleotidyltransferase family protein [Ruminococcus sp.]
MELKIGCVLMASGNAKRFGDNKLNKKLNGISLIDRALNAIPVDKLYKVAVVSQYSEVIDKAHRYGFTGIKNKHPDYGISHTIKLGLDATNDCDAVMFMVSDQPLLRKDSVSQMLDFYIKNSKFLVGMSYKGVRGNPCVFPKEFFDGLRKLTEDNGGNTIIRMHEDRLKLFEVDHPDELSDIDTKEDLEKLENTEV